MGDSTRQNGDEEFRAVFEGSLDAILITDDDARYVAANPAACALLGAPLERILGRRPEDFTDQQDVEFLRQTFTEQGSLRGEFVIVRPDGTRRLTEFAARANVTPGRHLSILRDITEHRRSESARRDAENRLSAILSMSPVAITATDRHGVITFAAGAILQRLGLDAAALVGRTIQDVFGATPCRLADGTEISANDAIARALAGAPTRASVRHGDVEFDNVVDALRDASGAVVGAIVVATDVTERSRAEDRLRRSEARFRALVDHSSDALKLISPDGTIRFASASSERVLGYTPEELVGRSVFELVHPEDAPALRVALDECLATPGVPATNELRYRHRSGAWRYLEVVRVSHLDQPDLAAVVVNLRDVTEERMLRKQVTEAQKLEAVARLAGGIAHDFNNVLMTVLGFAQLVASGLGPRDPLREHVLEIVQAGERAAELTRQLLAFSRRQKLEPRIVDVSAHLGSMHAMLRRVAGEEVELRIEVASAPTRIVVDPSQFEQVVMNLVVNARDAMNRGGILTIETSVEAVDGRAPPIDLEPGTYVVLSVSDTGEGIPLAVRDRIFEPFFTTKPEGKGTGLGLATVLGIVKQSRGGIAVESDGATGTTFRVYFPRTDALAAPADREPARRATGRPPSQTVLVVEDEHAVRRLVRAVLAREGYRVFEASNAGEALLIVEEQASKIDLLITDVVMPRLRGPELAARIDRIRPGLRVLYMSGYAEPAAGHPGLEGAEILWKPIRAEELLDRVRGALASASPAPS